MPVDCKFNIKGINKSLNLMELTKHYYTSTSELKNSKIFSSDDIVNSIMTPIKEQLRRRDEIFNDESKIGVYKFITTKQEELFKELNIPNERLAPEYMVENRILNSIKQKLELDHINISNKTTLDELKKSTDPEIAQKTAEYEKDILDTIEVEEKTKNLGNGFHSLLNSLSYTKGDFNSNMDLDLENLIIDNKDILDGDEVVWFNKFKNILQTIYDQLDSRGTVLSEILLASDENAPVQIKGSIDIIVIDDAGGAHIYDLKVSKNSYDNWDAAKLRTADWQLVMYRQLLGQYINIKNISSLNIIPIEIGSLGVNKKFTSLNTRFSKIVSRSGENIELQLPNGKMSLKAEKFIPSKFNVTYDPERRDKLIADLGLVFPNYKIKTTSERNDPKSIIDKAITKDKFEFFSEIDDESLGLVKGKNYKFPIIGLTKEQIILGFTKVVEEYTDKLKQTGNYKLIQLKDKIASAINNPTNRTIEIKGSDTQTIFINKLLKPFVNGNYQVLENVDELTALGFIVLKNKANNQLVVMSMTANQSYASYSNQLDYNDVEYIKTILFLNNFYDELNLGFNKISHIIPFNLEAEQSPSKSLENMFKLYFDIMQNKKLPNRLSYAENVIPIESTSSQAVKENLALYDEADKEDVSRILLQFGPDYQSMELYKLKVIHKEFANTYPELKQRAMSPEISFNDKKEYIYALLSTLILVKSGETPVGDFIGMKDFSISFTDFKSILASLYTETQEKYDSAEKKILGLIGGLKTITPDKVGSKDLQNINIAISGANSHIRHDMYKQSADIAMLTKKFYKEIGYSSTSQNWIGNARDKVRNLWEKDSKNEISNTWKLKNVYTDQSLTEFEKEYGKKMLFEIQKYILNIPEKDWAKIDLTSLETIEKTDKSGIILKNIESGRYFEMPLIRSQQMNRHAKVITEGLNGLWEDLKGWLDETKDFLDPRELSEEDIKNARETALGFYEMYDVYGRQGTAFKTSRVNEDGANFYEIDLDTIAHRAAFNKIRKGYIDSILPYITSYVWWMKLSAGKQNKNISKELEYITNRIKLGAFDEQIIDPEFKDPIRLISSVKRITTAAMLGFRPALMFKELSIGMYRTISLTAFNIYGKDQFTFKDFAKTIKVMTTIDNKMSKEWNLLDGINFYYGFANMDINTVSQKLQTNRRGVFLGLSKWMYACNTIPDYYNRLALFIAKMMHDGSYDAHSMNEKGLIEYDPKKDTRFSYYLENREKNKDINGNFIPAKNDVKYNEQRNLYNLVRIELNDEFKKFNKPELLEENMINQAYSEKERASYKSFTDTVYGYYDKDSQAEWHNTWYGLTFLQFMQFWPGKMSMWFGKPIDAQTSVMGKHVQLTTKDETGKDIPLWRTPIYSDENPDEIIGFEHGVENTGDPALGWVGTPQEGLIYSIGYTVQHILKGEWDTIKNDSLRNNRVGYAMADTLLMFLIFGIMKALWDGYIAENGTDGVLGTTAEFMSTVDKKALTEANLWQNTLGALKTEPAFWSYGTKLAGNIHSVFDGNKSFNQLIAKDVSAFEFWHPE